MNTKHTGDESWLFGELASHLASALETMAGSAQQVRWDMLASVPSTAGLWWRQPLAPLPGAIWIGIADEGCFSLGAHLLAAVGVEDASPNDCKGTYLEVLGQTLSGAARSLTGRFQKEVTCADGKESPLSAADAAWVTLQVPSGSGLVTMYAGIETTLLASPVTVPAAAKSEPPRASAARVSVDDSQTFDLLLDVELPVSVSFGRAQIPLKDVLKLTTGSIIELDRAIVEPVDILVNDNVVARGEVVVVEGNFGVRIQHVVSREERARTFKSA